MDMSTPVHPVATPLVAPQVFDEAKIKSNAFSQIKRLTVKLASFQQSVKATKA